MEFKRAAFLISALFWLFAAPVWLWRGMTARHAPVLALSGFVVLVPAALAMMVLPPQAVLIVLVLVWVADIAAYFVGSRFGRHKLAPAISPGKTWEGAGGALVATLAYAIVGGALISSSRAGIGSNMWAVYLAAAAGLCALSILGDLFESAAKRQAAVKDSGALLPGHGGILDRIDSATSTLPLAALLWPLIGGK
jgi:phosphatidate cytidylyltransferase